MVNTGIKKGDIYGMDESGFPPADQEKSKVVGVRGTKTQHKQGAADWENRYHLHRQDKPSSDNHLQGAGLYGMMVQ